MDPFTGTLFISSTDLNPKKDTCSSHELRLDPKRPAPQTWAQRSKFLGLGFRVLGLGFRVFGFRVLGLGFRVFGFRV